MTFSQQPRGCTWGSNNIPGTWWLTVLWATVQMDQYDITATSWPLRTSDVNSINWSLAELQLWTLSTTGLLLWPSDSPIIKLYPGGSHICARPLIRCCDLNSMTLKLEGDLDILKCTFTPKMDLPGLLSVFMVSENYLNSCQGQRSRSKAKVKCHQLVTTVTNLV